MEQFEQLLTCAICLDRYRNPKLLPCQHSFCMEPCMDGLVDYVRRQVKCPECRAEHRIPYQGVQGYPTNVTLQRFLELHIEITGELPDPTSGQIMERCNVCSEKAYCSMCVHCDKKICGDCKGAHMDILRREISRINNQIRRGLHRLQDMLVIVEKNMLNMQQNCSSVTEEVDEIYRRLAKALKDRTEYLRGEIEKYNSTELRNLSTLKENLEQEIANIQSNCDLADKHMTEDVDWDDCELMDAKEIFLKTVDFIRNFEYETTDYNRRVRFAMAHDPNQLVLHVAGYGELTINAPQHPPNSAPGLMGSGSSTNLLQPPGPGLMRSKSDHRLTTQFRQDREDRGYGDRYGEEESFGSRKFGERFRGGNTGYNDRYGRQEYGSEFESPYDSEPRRSGFRSRFRRDRDNDSDNDAGQTRSVRFSEPQHKERERVLDTEDVSRGPLSGITRLYDSPRVMQRIAEIGKEKKKPEPKPEPPVAKFQPPKKAQRQVSEEDEITRIKKMNKQGAAESQTETRQTPTLKRGSSRDREERTTTPREDTRKTPPVTEVPSSEGDSEEEEEEEEEQEELPSLQNKPKTATPTTNSANASRRSSASSDLQVLKKTGRSASTDSTTSTESSQAGSNSGIKNTGAAYTTEEVKQKFLKRGSIDKGSDVGSGSGASTPRGRLRIPTIFLNSSTGSDTTKKESAASPGKFQSRFLNRQSIEKPVPTKEEEEETESSSESETDSDEDSEDDKRKTTAMDKTDIGPLLARSAQARDSGSIRRGSRDEDGAGYRSRLSQDSGSSLRSSLNRPDESATRSRYGQDDSTRSRYGLKDEEPYSSRSRYGQDDSSSSRYLNRNKEEEQPKYGGYTSRFLNKSKSTAAVSPDEEADKPTFPARKYSTSGIDDDGKYSSTRSRYAALKDRQNRIARSRSSHNFGNPDDDDEEDLNSPTSYLQSKYGTSSGNDLSRSRSTHHLKSRESSPDRPGPGSEKDGAALSSWARYLKNKYGNRGKDNKDTAGNSSAASAGAGSSVSSRRLSLGLPLRHNSASFESSDDDQKNMSGSPTSPTATAAAGFVAAAAGSTLRNQYLQKRRQLFKMGSRGSEPGCFTWPRGIAVGTDNSIVVADSSNHRVQVFDSNGNFLKEFGHYGNGEGEFDCLAGVAVNRIGQFIIADRYNHRIQVLDPSGRFLRAFGSQGTGDGRFNYPWGITTDALGFIYVCDKENHRVQVFQSDGTFVGKFGSHGNKSGQLEHPHYIAVSNTNRVIVSDSNNHRVQIFDVNGRVLSSFGSEGAEEGQFKFPRGVAVDDQGYIFVGDSGNNRIQIFNPDGTFLRAFGCWGSGDGEFKGLEGVAVMSNGNILVCDRENHRIQVF
ncbi:UNVERIFIED_CONTAM: hypothetical protein PYX00_010235 [Menopon gallinae]|uniref:RING-type domain-containing protein n=1 Tax=Menopon gallinae TaxID=328185 RepID=A0AAW2HET5_9NEOP